MEKFKIGDRVVYITAVSDNERVVQQKGEIVNINPHHTTQKYGVRFNNNIDGHHLDDNCSYGHGWWCAEEDLILDPIIAFNNLLNKYYETSND